MRDEITAQAKNIEKDAVYSFKGHFNAAAKWNKIHLCTGCIVAGTSVMAGSIVFTKVFESWELIAGCLALRLEMPVFARSGLISSLNE
jgi:hypothetical protein